MSSPVIVITGASSGIGAATARLFATEGYRVVLAARRIKRLEILATEIKEAGGEVLFFQTDVSQVSQLEHLIEQTLVHYGQIDILLNNAGFGRLIWLDEQDLEEDIATQIQVNVTGVIQASRLVLPHMIKRKCGHIINISSAAGWLAPPTYSVYAATKYAIRGFAEGLHREVKELGLHVSTIYPGAVTTEFNQHAGVDWQTESVAPKWFILSAEDIARSILRVANNKHRELIIPWVLNLVIWLNGHFPSLVDWVSSKYFSRDKGNPIVWGT